MAALLSVEDALARILERAQPLPAESVPLAQAATRFLAEDATSAVDLPPFPSSAMDGFAVRAENTPGTLPIAFRIAAGRPSPRRLEVGEAMAIATGGVVPEGADAVVPIEYVVEHDNKVEIPEPVPASANVRPRGGDLRAGELVVRTGTRLGPAHIGALAAAGVAEVRCARRPRAAVVVTGTEVRPPGVRLRLGEIYDANGPMLEAQLRAAGADVQGHRVVADHEGDHRAALAGALTADLVVTSGGVSVGPHDLVRRVEAELGVEEVFWGVAVKPGKPLAFGVREGTLLFGLPGNPVSSLVGVELFVRPALQAMQGAADPGPPFELGQLGAAVRQNGARDQLLRAKRKAGEAGPVLVPLSGQESHMIARAATADALVLVPRGEGELAPGTAVRFLRLDPVSV